MYFTYYFTETRVGYLTTEMIGTIVGVGITLILLTVAMIYLVMQRYNL